MLYLERAQSTPISVARFIYQMYQICVHVPKSQIRIWRNNYLRFCLFGVHTLRKNVIFTIMERSLGVRTIEPLPRFLYVTSVRSFSRSSNMPFGPVKAAEQNSSFTSSQPWIPWNCQENRALAKLNNPFCVDFVFLSIRCH